MMVRNSAVKSMQSLAPAYHVMMSAIILCAACQGVEQGYWTKQGVSQAQFTADYRRDFQACVREGMEHGLINDGAPETDTIRATHPSTGRTGSKAYNDCMYARGYEWIKMEPLVGPNAHGSTAHLARCPEDRVIVDPYGYPHCATPDQIHPARSIDVPRIPASPATLPPTTSPPIPSPRTSAPSAIAPTNALSPEAVLREGPEAAKTERAPIPDEQSKQRRAFDESLCIQHSQASLSNPYETFLRCMEERGWPPSPSK